LQQFATVIAFGVHCADWFGGGTSMISLHMLKTSNQPMKPTQHFVVSFRPIRAPIFKVLGGLSLSR
jgi:hypothetical protein